MIGKDMSSKALCSLFFGLLMLALAGCGAAPAISATQPQQVATINPGFQSRVTAIPTVPLYRCGAWTSNNAPNPGGMITVFARLTHNGKGVAGIAAVANVHFQSGNVTLNQATSDAGGYVSFSLSLQNRQPTLVPALVAVTFSGLPGGRLGCTAFFTPR
jgi:hypothetical protein